MSNKEAPSQEELEKKEDEIDKKERLKMIADWNKVAEERTQLRKANLAAQKARPDASFFKQLDSSIQKNTKFVQRIRRFAEVQADQKRAIVPELQKLNLRRYVDELVQGISAIPLQVADLPIIVQIISSLHQFYSEFSESIITALVKSCTSSGSITDMSKFRMVLVLITELYLVGMHSDATVVINLVKGLIVKEQDKRTQAVVSAILFFLNMHGDELISLTHTSDTATLHATHRAFTKERIIGETEAKTIRDLVTQFFQFLCDKLYNDFKELKQMEEEKHNDLMAGVNQDQKSDKASYDRLNKAWFKLYMATKELGELLGKDLPSNLDEGLERYTESTNDGFGFNKGKDGSAGDLFEDEETRLFYNDIPDIEKLIKESGAGDEKEDDKDDSAEGTSTKVEKLMNSLPKSCMSRALMTQWIIEFCAINSKSSRRKLAKTIFGVNRTSLELLPHYSRLVAILAPVYKDIPQSLIASLEDEFFRLFNEKDQIKIETKIKNIRFIGELTKFKIAPPQTALSFLSKCLDDFRHHNIDVACHLLETCGRFLFINNDTHDQAKELLAKMMRFKDVKTLDPSYENMVENAYYVSVPQQKFEEKPIADESLPPLHRYINYLLYDSLSKNTVNTVLKQLRKLPWNDATIPRHIALAVCDLIGIGARYSQVHLLAGLISSLSRYHEIVGIMIVDRFIESLRLRLAGEMETSRQKTLLELKFLAELYNYQMLDSNVILDLLYSCLLYQTSATDTNPNDTFRLRQVIILLETSGPYFETPLDRKRLDRFLLYLQWYVLKKGVRLPVDLEFQLADCLDAIRPRLKWPLSFQDADERVKRIEKQSRIPLPGRLDGDITVELENNVMWSVGRVSDSDNADDANVDTILQSHEQDKALQEQQENEEKRVQRRLEDLKFDKEFQSMVQESLSERKTVQKPMKMLAPKELLQKSGATLNPFQQALGSGQVKFTMLMRRGKTLTKDINVPETSTLAQHFANTDTNK